MKNLYSLSHNSKYLFESMGIPYDRFTDLYSKVLVASNSYKPSIAMQEIMNNDRVTDIEKYFMVYTFGGIVKDIRGVSVLDTRINIPQIENMDD